MSRIALVIALVLALPWLPASALPAVPHADDDAGSGRDAGEHASDAVPIAPGTYAGHVAFPTDSDDAYLFHARRGDLVDITTSSASSPPLHLWLDRVLDDGSTTPVTDGETLSLMIPADGTYLLDIEAPTQLGVTDLPYTFTLRFPPTPTVAELDGAHAWETLELSFAAPTDIGYELRVDADPSDEPSLGLVFVNARSPGFSSVFEYFVGRGSQQVRALGTTQQVRTAQAPQSLLLEAGTLRGYTGQMRWTSVASSVAHQHARLLLVATTPAATAHAAGDDVVTWSPFAGLDEVAGTWRAPSASTTVEVGPHFLGAIDARMDATATSPDGRTFGGSIVTPVYWENAQPGTWTATLPEQTHEADMSPDQPFLVGADVPRLGVADFDGLKLPFGS